MSCVTINVIASCTDRKKAPVDEALRLRNIRSGNVEERVHRWWDGLKNNKGPEVRASELYAGAHWSVIRELPKVAGRDDYETRLWVISAGYGLVPAESRLHSYSATFAKTSEDTVFTLSGNGSTRREALQKWWTTLSILKRNDGVEPSSIADLASKSRDDYYLVIASPDYLLAAEQDLLTAISVLSDPQRLVIVSSDGGSSLKSLENHTVPSDSRLQQTVGGTLGSLHAKVASLILEHVADWGFTANSIKAHLLKKIALNGPRKKIEREAMNDAEVRAFIAAALNRNPPPNYTPLLRELRNSGRACEQGRFKSLYKEIKLRGTPASSPAEGGGAGKERTKATRPNPKVDKVIEIPASWWNKPHKKSLMYFIPDWDDRVDPDYDFNNDIHSGEKGHWSNEVYAHQIYREPNYDGILISKVVAEKGKDRKRLINDLGVHRFLRVPRRFPILGDCGAFDYIKKPVPPYETNEILDYYTRLDFDLGVSIDHLIVAATEDQRKFRYELTINNAEEFLREHRKRGLKWEPIGAVQGWDVNSYVAAASKYVKMGYRYIALGGLVRTNDDRKVLEIVEQVRKVVPKRVKIHLFGLARLQAIGDFVSLGVNSIDSASFLRKAWLGSKKNYLTLGGWHSAIRIPQAQKSFRARRAIKDGLADLEKVSSLESECLRALREYAKRSSPPSETLVDVLAEYEILVSDEKVRGHRLTPERTRDRIRRVLTERPWTHCGCEICRRCGVEVIIFRGNNRNRRRGFHNVHVFYKLLEKLVQGEYLPWLDGDEIEESPQHKLFAAV